MIEVIIPAYNCFSTLRNTLYSLAAQIDKNFKVLLVDDCSTEDILSIVDEFKNILDIRYIRNECNLGCGMTRQTGIDNAVGDYITFLDSDDVFMPYTIEVFNKISKSRPNVNIFHSYFYEQEIYNGTSSFVLHKDGYTWCHGKLYKMEFLKKYNIRNLPEVKYADDSFFNSMCSELSDYSIIEFPMMVWLNNKDSITRKTDGIYQKEKMSDFINAMMISVQFVSKYKSVAEISHLPYTLNIIKYSYDKNYSSYPMEEQIKIDEKLNNLKKLLRSHNYDCDFLFKNNEGVKKC